MSRLILVAVHNLYPHEHYTNEKGIGLSLIDQSVWRIENRQSDLIR